MLHLLQKSTTGVNEIINELPRKITGHKPKFQGVIFYKHILEDAVIIQALNIRLGHAVRGT